MDTRPEPSPPLRLPGPWAWPDGSAGAAALTVEAMALQMLRLRLAGSDRPWLARAATWPGFVQQRRPDAPVPLALADFAYALADGGPRRAFGMAPLMHASFDDSPVRLRSRVVSWWLDPRFHAGDSPFPADLRLDAGDGLGPRAVPASGVLTACYGSTVSQVELVLHAGTRQARCRIGIGTPVAPMPDASVALPGATAWVFLAPGRPVVQRPVIVCEGFPGGYACDWFHDLMNQQGTLDAMRQRGHDVVLLGFANGAGPIDANADALSAAIRALDPVAVGGVSMGGLVARQALAAMDARGEPHRVALFFTIDTPHQGAYTPLSVQWFVHAYAAGLGGAAGFAALIDSVANQQFVKRWLRQEDGIWQTGPSPQRAAWLARLAEVGGYPTRPRKLALACGRGDGQRQSAPGALQLQWDDGQGLLGELHALGGSAPLGAGSGTALPPLMVGDALPGEPAWDGLPGSTNSYVAAAAALLAAQGPEPKLPIPLNLSIPTVSALDIDLPADQPIPADARSPFDEWHYADANLPHLALTPALRDALLAALPPPPPGPQGTT